MRYENKRWNRNEGHFTNGREFFDYSNIKILHTGVDTVKQLFKCLLKTDVLLQLQQIHDSELDNVICLDGFEFSFSRSSKQAGYQWILKNGDLGFVVLLKSFYAQSDLHDSHIKIEVSPRAIYEHGEPENLDKKLIKIARLFGNQIQQHAVAAHLAVDLKGFEIPDDFEYQLVTKAKRQMRFTGISDASSSIAETAVIYGDRQTFTFGSAAGLQFQLYDKVTESIKSDKIDFWEYKWRQTSSTEDCFKPEYEPGDSVKRIEIRFHHSVIQQFVNGTFDHDGKNIVIRNFEDLCKHLTALWQYGLNNFRLQHSSVYIHPVWQLLEDDVQIYAPRTDFVYKRSPKPPTENSKRNVAFWLGNSLKLLFRKGYKVEYAVKHIISSGLHSDLRYYLGMDPGGSDTDLKYVLHEFIKDKFDKYRLIGVHV